MLLSPGVRKKQRACAKQRAFLTNVNSAAAIAVSMKFNPQQEQAMGAKSKSGTIRSAPRKHAAKAPAKRGRRATSAPAAWEQTAQVPEERGDEIDCQRIVQDEGGRSRPRYFDDYN
jgi:hypothetical protein